MSLLSWWEKGDYAEGRKEGRERERERCTEQGGRWQFQKVITA